MAAQAARAAMNLSYVEPGIVLPLVMARFQQAVETVHDRGRGVACRLSNYLAVEGWPLKRQGNSFGCKGRAPWGSGSMRCYSPCCLLMLRKVYM